VRALYESARTAPKRVIEVRFGSLADLSVAPFYVCLAAKSGHNSTSKSMSAKCQYRTHTICSLTGLRACWPLSSVPRHRQFCDGLHSG
jgi:hypothetical protein